MAKEEKQAALGFIFVTLLIDVIGFGLVIPILPQLITQLIHSNLSDASRYGGWLIFTYAIMQFIFSPVLGNLSDAYGRRPVLLFSLLGLGLDYILQGVAPNIYWLFLGRIIAGIAGGSFTTASAYIADISTPEKRAQNFGMVGAAFGVGFIIGPMLGGILGHYGVRIPFFVAAGLALVNWLYGYFVLPESLSHDHRRVFEWKRANPLGTLINMKRHKELTILFISVFLLNIASHAVQSTWTFYTMEKFNWDTRMVGYSLAFVGLMVGLVQGVLIRIIIPKIGQKRSIYIGFCMNFIGLNLFAFATQGWMLFPFLILYSLGAIAGPAIQSIISGHVSPGEQGELQGALTSLISLGAIIGPLIMTNIFSYFTSSHAPIHFPGAPMMLGAIFSIAGIILAYKTLRHEQ